MVWTRKIENIIWSTATFLPVSLVSLCYIFFKADFAKWHFNPFFLSVPVFVGEILLFYCSLLLILWWIRNPPVWDRSSTFVVAYLVWFTVKVVHGYDSWGPLALRHAALFYYPFFFMVGYIFFNRQLFTKWVLLGLFCVIEGIFLSKFYDHYWVFTLGCLGLILVLNIKDKKFAIAMALVLFFSIPYLSLFKIARMMFVANMASLLLLMAAIFYLLDTKLYIKILIIILIGAGVSLGFYRSFVLGESNRIYTPPAAIINKFDEVDKTVQTQKSNFQLVSRKPDLYNSHYNKISLSCIKPKSPCLSNSSTICKKPVAVIQLKDDKVVEESVSINNIVFRLLIWRDMWEDWKSKKPLWGFDFGRPLRSPSLEVLHWAEKEWGRDGWIEPHNSYLNILYRAGIVGIIYVIFMWGWLIWFIRLAFKQRSWILILLAAILLNWMVAANFLLILELPYTAIPFWTLAGMAFAYAYKNTDIHKGAYEIER